MIHSKIFEQILRCFILAGTRKLAEVTEDWLAFPENKSCLRTHASVSPKSLEHRAMDAVDKTSTKHVTLSCDSTACNAHDIIWKGMGKKRHNWS